jgi:hypothetical protein
MVVRGKEYLSLVFVMESEVVHRSIFSYAQLREWLDAKCLVFLLTYGNPQVSRQHKRLPTDRALSPLHNNASTTPPI